MNHQSQGRKELEMDIAPATTFDVLMFFIFGVFVGIVIGYVLKVMRSQHEKGES